MTSRTVDPVYIPATILVPHGTTAAAPLTTPIVLDHGTLESVTLQIPPGHSGTTGIRFTLAGQQILPWSNAVSWITGDNLYETFEVGVEVDSGFAAVAFNVGNYDHSFLLRFKVRMLPASTGVPTLRLIDSTQLSA